MTEFRIIAVRLMPWWKQILKTGDNIEVIIEDDRGNMKTVTIFDRLPVIKSLLKNFIAKNIARETSSGGRLLRRR